MTDSPEIIHDTIKVERILNASPERVFFAWADSEARKRWEPTPEGMLMEIENHDFRVGGYEHARMTKNGDVLVEFDTWFVDIVENTRIISSVRACSGGNAISSSQNTIDIRAERTGTKITCVEQVAWLHGQNMRAEHESGWSMLLDNLTIEAKGA